MVLLSHTWTESKARMLIAQHRRCSTALASRAKWCSSSASQSQRTAHQPCSCFWPRSLWRGSPTLVRGHVHQSPPPPAQTPGPPYSPPRSEAPSRSASHGRSGPAWVWCPAEQTEKVRNNVYENSGLQISQFMEKWTLNEMGVVTDLSSILWRTSKWNGWMKKTKGQGLGSVLGFWNALVN